MCQTYSYLHICECSRNIHSTTALVRAIYAVIKLYSGVYIYESVAKESALTPRGVEITDPAASHHIVVVVGPINIVKMSHHGAFSETM